MERRRTREDPLNALRGVLVLRRCPRVVRTLRPVRLSQVNNVEEVQEAERAQIASITTYNVPPEKRVGVVEVATRHPCETLEVLGEECKVYPSKKQREVRLPGPFRVLAPGLFTDPEIECREDSEHGTHTQYIVKVRYNIICQYKLVLPQGSDSLLPRSKNLIYLGYRV